jgi:hypothetical protein
VNELAYRAELQAIVERCWDATRDLAPGSVRESDELWTHMEEAMRLTETYRDEMWKRVDDEGEPLVRTPLGVKAEEVAKVAKASTAIEEDRRLRRLEERYPRLRESVEAAARSARQWLRENGWLK